MRMHALGLCPSHQDAAVPKRFCAILFCRGVVLLKGGTSDSLVDVTLRSEADHGATWHDCDKHDATV